MTTVALHADQVLYRVPGGIGTYVRELVPAIAEADPSLEITLFHARFPRGPETWMESWRTVELPGTIKSLYSGWNTVGRPALPPALRGADIVHAPSPGAVPPAASGQRLVVTVHDLAVRVYPRLFPRRWRALFRLGLRRAARTADAILAVSENTARDLVRLEKVDSSRVHVTPLAASLPRDSADPEDVTRRLRIPKPYVLTVGTLEPRKNLARLVRAYRSAAASGLPHALAVVGPRGWAPQSLDRELAEDAPGRVVVTGAVSRHDLDALYRGASAFVYPSLYEGFGLPVLEAMARGVPTIASSSSSIPEIAGDAAVLVDPRSERAIADALGAVLGDGAEASRLGEAGRSRARGFSWERTAKATVKVYEEVLGEAG